MALGTSLPFWELHENRDQQRDIFGQWLGVASDMPDKLFRGS